MWEETTMKRIRAVLLMLTLALGVLALPRPALAAVGDTFTEPVTIGNETVDCVFKVTGEGMVSVGAGGFETRGSGTSTYVDSANPALAKVPTQVDSDSSYVLAGCGELKIPTTITHGGTVYSVTGISSGAFYRAVGITSVVIPSGVTTIGEGAFCECEALTSVNIPSGVKAIPDFCFYGCMALRGIDGAANVTSIGRYAYRNCDALHSVSVPAKVTSIGEYAFVGCSALEQVTMGNAVTSVGDNAFADDPALESVTLSTSLTTLPERLFMQDYNLSTVKNTSQLTDLGEYLFESCSNLRSFTIPSGVKAIPERAFEGTGLTSITIPDGVELIDDSAFRQCHNLRSVTFPQNGSCKLGYAAFTDCVALETIDLSHVSELIDEKYLGSYAFGGCSGLTSVTIGSQLTRIPEDTFSRCTALTSITFPAQVTELGEGAFNDCTALSSVTIPATLTSLHNEAFDGCYGLSELVLEGSEVKTLNSAWSSTYAYEFTQGFCHIYVPDALVSSYKADETWSSLADYILPVSQRPSDRGIHALLKTDGSLVQCDASGKALSGGKSFVVQDNASSDYAKYAVTDVHFQSGITELPLGAFAYCTALKKVELPSSVTSIGETAFYHCPALQSVSGSAVTSVEYRAFGDCHALRSVGFMSKLTTLGVAAFRSCLSLEEAKLSPTLQNVDDYAFGGCWNLSSVTLPTDSEYLEIGEYAFSSCSALQRVSMPASLAFMGDRAFYYSGLTSVDVPSALFQFGTQVFENCRHLTSAHVRPTGGYVQNSMFENCTALRSVTLEDGTDSIMGSAFSGCQALQEISFPSSLTSISNMAFYNCSGLLSIELPRGLSSLDAGFASCTGLSRITLPSSLTHLDFYKSGNEARGAFSSCSALSSVVFEDGYAANIGGYMFSGCAALESLDIPDAVTSIDDYGINGCYLLKDLHLPASLSYLGAECLGSCISQTEMDLSFAEGLSIDDYNGGQFAYCLNLKKITLPASLTSIAPAMFAECISLSEITIPAAVDYVGSVAFRGCSALETVIFDNDCSACTFGNAYGDVFRKCNALANVVFRDKKPQDGAIDFPNDPTFYYTVRYYPLEELTSDRANCIGQLTVKAGTNVLGSSAPAAANIYDGEWIQATTAEPAINASKLSDSGWALPGSWTGVLFVTQPKGGDTADGSFTLSAEARVRRVSGGSATDTGDNVSYAWYACDAVGNRTGNSLGSSATLALTGLSEGKHYYVCVASSTASGLNRPTVTSQVACVNIKTGRLSANPESISYRWPVSASTSGYGPSVTITNTSSFTIKNITWKSKNGYFEISRATSGNWGDVDAGVSFNPTLHPNIPDAQAKEYTDTLIISADNAITLEVPVTLKFYDASASYADFSYTSSSGGTVRDTTVDFGTLEEGYTNPQDNYGIQCVLWAEGGEVTFTGRSNPEHFTVYNENISSYPRTLNNMGSGLKIAPKEGLAQGNYQDNLTYTYRNDEGQTEELVITLKVSVRGAGGITVSPTSCDWGSAEEGYAASAAKTITVGNNGDSTVTLQGNSLQSFTATGLSGLSIPVGQSKTFTVAPKTGLTAGTYNETLKLTPSSGQSKSVKLTFKVTAKPVPVSSVTLSDGSLDLETGESATLGVTIEPENATDQTLTWTTSDASVVRVNANGKVTALKAGTATITVTAASGVEDSCTITVTEGEEPPVTGGKWVRLAGKGRYQTMAAIVREGFSTSDWAVIATGDNFPDALVASSLAGYRSCPVILTAKGELSSEAEATLRSLRVRNAYIMGGTGAVSAEVEDAIRGLGIDVTRVKGSGRQATSLAAMEQLSGYDTIVVATGGSFADALSIGPWCYAKGAPILLTDRGELSSDQLAALEEAAPSRVLIVGGTGAVPQAVEDAIAEMGIEVMRIKGANRYATSKAIAEFETSEAEGMGYTSAAVATGKNFPDALAGAALCGYYNSVLILAADTNPAGDGMALALAKANDAEVVEGYVLGGAGVVSGDILDYLNGR